MTVTLDLAALRRASPDDLRQWLAMLEAAEDKRAQELFYALFPDEDTVWDGPDLLGGKIVRGQVIHARRRYARHLEFFEAGARYRERCMMAANRVGKTFSAGGYETACHLTGLYPEWWPGRRFDHPVMSWAAGKSLKTTRDIVQETLFGSIVEHAGRKSASGRGVIPGTTLDVPKMASGGVIDLIDTIRVQHVSGGWSTVGLKSYEQGRGSFEGQAIHVIWFDEEPPRDVYGEALIRTATLNGLIMLTFTPLEGISDTVMQFLPAEMRLEEQPQQNTGRGWSL